MHPIVIGFPSKWGLHGWWPNIFPCYMKEVLNWKWAIPLHWGRTAGPWKGLIQWGYRQTGEILSKDLVFWSFWELWATLSMGAPLGNLKGGSFTRNFMRQMKNSSGNRQPVYGSSLRGTLREGSFLGTLKNFTNRYNEHIRYTRSKNAQVACAVHILSNGHEYGPVDEIMKLAKPKQEGCRMNAFN